MDLKMLMVVQLLGLWVSAGFAGYMYAKKTMWIEEPGDYYELYAIIIIGDYTILYITTSQFY